MQVQRHLQLRIEAQGKYMQSILEKACQTLAGENMAASGGYKAMGGIPNNNNNQQGISDMAGAGGIKDFGSPLGFPSFQDLNLYGGDHLDLQQNVDGFMPHNDSLLCLGKKKPRPPPSTPNYGASSGKGALDWPDDLRLQDIGMAPPSCVGQQEDDFKGIGGTLVERDHLEEMYEAKPVVSDEGIGDHKKYDINNNDNNNNNNNNNDQQINK